MRRKTFTYLGIVAVFTASLVVMLLFAEDFIQNLAVIPLVGSLFAAIFQIFRDQAAHDRAINVLDIQNRFSFGSSSHMANTAFDKHVQFCEEYVAEVQNTFLTLFREGPTAEVLQHASALYGLRRKHAVWLTDQIERDLDKFEAALRHLGATEHYIERAPNAADRPRHIAAVYKTFADLMGAEFMGSKEWEGESLTEELAVTMVIRRLRSVLGTEELSEMRTVIVTKALASLRLEAPANPSQLRGKP